MVNVWSAWGDSNPKTDLPFRKRLLYPAELHAGLFGGRYPIRTDGQLLTVAGFQDHSANLPEVLVRGIGFEPMTKELCLPL